MRFTNSLRLSRFIVRRDHITFLFWLIGIVGLVVVFAAALTDMYSSDAELAVMAETMKNPAMIAMLGPVYGSDSYTNGAMFSNMMLLWTAVFTAVMSILHVVRHTRRDEEDGRIETVRSLPVGRMSNLASAMITALFLNLVIGVVTGVGLSALGIDSMGIEGSFLFGAVIVVTGLLFAAVTAVFCQLFSTSRGATSMAFIFLGITYLIRAAGDIKNETLALISPLGLVLRAQVYVDNNWWPVAVAIAITAAVMILAFFLCGRRDLGTGLIPARPGRSHASKLLNGTIGLSLRILRTPIIIWTATIFILAAAYASVLGDMDSFISSSDLLRAAFSGDNGLSYTEQFITMIVAIMSMISTIAVLSFALKARSQEKYGYTENILVRAVSRSSQLGAYVEIAFLSSFVMQILTVLGFWSIGSMVMNDPIAFSTYFKAAFAYLPAMWIMLGATMLLIAYLPKKTTLIWIYLGYSFIAVYMGALLKFPEWVQRISPFGNIPQYPAETMDYTKLIAMTGIAVAMSILGFIGHSKRDMKFQ